MQKEHVFRYPRPLEIASDPAEAKGVKAILPMAEAERESPPTRCLAADLEGLALPPRAKALDAGCGTGTIARELASAFPEATVEACDVSELQLKQAEKLGKGARSVRFFKSPLTGIDRPDENYDLVFCRDVFSLVEEPARVSSELFRVLRPGGKARIIEFDGLLLNLFPATPSLRRMLDELEKHGPADLRIGRKLPQLLSASGFRRITWEVAAVRFEGDALASECREMEQRLAFAMPLLEKALGSHQRAESFRRLYLDEMTRPDAVLFYNKFVVHGSK
jgi:ubiquinone/menaquinone biosynthesis C-methylase UbiE